MHSDIPSPSVAIIFNMAEIGGQTKVVGIIGDPVTHSLSPRMHNAAFAALGLNWRYLAFHVAARDLAQALRGIAALGVVGVNVTVPHKEAAAEMVDDLDPVARRIGAVNTIRVWGGRLQGFNTDAAGVLDALARDGQVNVEGKRCVVIGAGGGARAAAFALAGASAARVTIMNRTVSRARGLAEMVAQASPGCDVDADGLTQQTVAEAMQDADVVIHATTATLSAAEGGAQADWLQALGRTLREDMVILDMVYAPVWTDILSAARGVGATPVSGLAMLVYQGARSFELWTGQPAPLDVMRNAVETGKLKS